MELRTALPALFDRFPGLSLRTSVEDLRFRRFSAVYGLDALPVTWGPATPAATAADDAPRRTAVSPE